MKKVTSGSETDQSEKRKKVIKERAVWESGLDFFLSALGYAGNIYC